jgi:antitoxin component of MazEF toxin-antitoxin module
MTTVVKLQKIGNSVRATIPKEILDSLSLSKGEDVIVSLGNDDTILLKKKKGAKRNDTSARFYGILKERTGKVDHWPTPEEIKNIWE